MFPRHPSVDVTHVLKNMRQPFTSYNGAITTRETRFGGQAAFAAVETRIASTCISPLRNSSDGFSPSMKALLEQWTDEASHPHLSCPI